MSTPSHPGLTRRERQIMDILLPAGPRHRRRGDGRGVPGEPQLLDRAHAAARARGEGARAAQQAEGSATSTPPAVPRHSARKSALKHLVETFFDGSPEPRWWRPCSAAMPRGVSQDEVSSGSRNWSRGLGKKSPEISLMSQPHPAPGPRGGKRWPEGGPPRPGTGFSSAPSCARRSCRRSSSWRHAGSHRSTCRGLPAA